METETNILIVDDNTDFCKSMASVMKIKGYNTFTAISGMEAIENVRKRDFDIIFMDIKMPFLNGVETFKEIKKIKPDTYVIMMTTYAV